MLLSKKRITEDMLFSENQITKVLMRLHFYCSQTPEDRFSRLNVHLYFYVPSSLCVCQQTCWLLIMPPTLKKFKGLMPPTLNKLKGHIALGLCICPFEHPLQKISYSFEIS